MRLIIVSNRLPLTAARQGSGVELKRSIGGLSTGLSSYLESYERASQRFEEKLWIGWAGPGLAEGDPELLRRFAEHEAHPVFLSEESIENFYQGFCNKTIWPLFHFFPGYARFESAYWPDYIRINERFAQAVLEKARPGDSVWIHDYHLMLLPELLRRERPGLSIGFFLHIPFPSFEIFRLLPGRWREAILRGMLGANLIGFHTYDYTQAFLRCVLRLLGYEHRLGRILADSRLIKVDTFPMGIDFDRFQETALGEAAREEKRKVLAAARKRKILLSVDRLDYTKGILQRLQGFEDFLEKNPSWRKRVNLILVLVPSRIGIELYDEMKRSIDENIGRINGRFGSPDWTPVLYEYRAKSLVELTALYSAADAALITPLRDGMNLIAKEYLASREDETGVLILSEMAGASQELGEALLVNPYSREEISEAIRSALEMSESDQIARNRPMRRRLQDFTIFRWADDFLTKLAEAGLEQQKQDAVFLSAADRGRVLLDFRQARRRLLLLDYDGTLVPLVRRIGEASPRPELVLLLGKLASLPNTETVVVSGRPREILDRWLGGLPLALVAEHGAWHRRVGDEWRPLKPLKAEWKKSLKPLLQVHVDRLPGSFVEEKEFSLAWHYRAAAPELAQVRMKELLDDLVQWTAKAEIQVLQGNKVVELRNASLSKADAALSIVAKNPYDFILAIGDDSTDEDLFRGLPGNAYSMRIGEAPTLARFNLRSYLDALDLLKDMAKALPIDPV
ncbi:MAG TPA: bifunctional alpha,alpha-trehalose-phosphate synthase (UDP-forming)/trehalose-phosphatase [bacterium]|nr:bifunctional alpha,alpha-trehalose-phosphate synthase (UDP-forming)/trehalose-phosphatase [bacterium]